MAAGRLDKGTQHDRIFDKLKRREETPDQCQSTGVKYTSLVLTQDLKQKNTIQKAKQNREGQGYQTL